MNLNGKNRKRIYRTAIAAVGVAVVYGVLKGDEAQAWLLLIAAALGLADKNVTED